MSATLESLIQDHRNMGRLLDAFERQLRIFHEAGEPDYELMQSALEYFLDYPDKIHHPKEDLVWARLVERDSAAVAGMGDLAVLHEELSALTHSIAYALKLVLQESTASRDWVGTSARNFLNAYRKHMEVEEALFFPLAAKALSAADWRKIDGQIKSADDPLFAPRDALRFESLRKYIEDLDQLAET